MTGNPQQWTWKRQENVMVCKRICSEKIWLTVCNCVGEIAVNMKCELLVHEEWREIQNYRSELYL